MKKSRFFLLVLVIGSLAVCEGLIAASSVEVVLPLHKAEPYGATIYHDGLFWVGQSRTEHPYLLQAYQGDGKTLLGQIKLPFSVSFVYPSGKNSVMVVGKNFTESSGYLTYYAIVSADTARRQLSLKKKYTFSMKYQVDQAASDGKNLFFSHPGDREVLTFGFWGPKRVNTQEVFGPGEMFPLGKSLLVLERPGPGLGNLAKLDLSTGKAARVFSGAVNSPLVNATALPTLGKVAIAAPFVDTILLYDPSSNSVAKKLSVSGGPRGLGLFGTKCLAVLKQTARKISFLDVTKPEFDSVGEIDLSSAGYQLSNPLYLAVNNNNSTLLVRSIAPCVLCEQSAAAVARVLVEESLRNSCR